MCVQIVLARLVVLESGLGLESGLESDFGGLGLGLGLALKGLGLGLGLALKGLGLGLGTCLERTRKFLNFSN